jgi:hypothetical protein
MSTYGNFGTFLAGVDDMFRFEYRVELPFLTFITTGMRKALHGQGTSSYKRTRRIVLCQYETSTISIRSFRQNLI